ncbi:uncharacterized protein LOC131627741 [Vicia villosa]|uniref:uncharacterized protein LOC131627741 n=1 Tax=Vicia villosa TaxID=3911 RepID=UPI00273B4ECC|nr:uncharacterized protein LOC131627741 [Vicia villosa]
MVGIDQTESDDFKLDAHGVFRFRNRICIPDDVDFKRAILEEGHRISKLAEIYINVIVKLHGVPLCIVSHRDLRFTSYFWKSLQGALGSKLRLSSAYYPQTNGQKERTIQSLEDFSRACDLEQGAGDHVFLRVTPVTGVGRALKSKKLTPRFIGPYQISEKVGNVAYRVALPPNLSNLHDVFHVSQIWKYISDPSHVIHMDDVQVWDNLMVETMPVRIEDRETKTLRGKEIALVKVVWSGATGESLTWELESKMRDSYRELFD